MESIFALSHVNLVDIENNQIRSGATVFCNADGRIDRIGVSDGHTQMPPNCREINLQGKYIMPGMINAHVHLFSSGKPMKNVENPKTQQHIFTLTNSPLGRRVLKRQMQKRLVALLHSGVTTVRCMGDPFYEDVALRDEIEAKKWLGPRVLASGYMISITGGHGTPFIALSSDSPWEGVKRVRENIRHGVDWIKICVTGGVTDARSASEAGRLQMTEEEVAAICSEAHKVGLMVAAHVESTDGIRVALRGGVDTIEHGSDLDDELINLFHSNPRSLRGYSALIPTLHPTIPILCLGQAASGMSKLNFDSNCIIGGRMIRGAAQALNANLRMGLGTDAAMSYVPHNSTWRELLYLNQCVKIEPWRALSLATRGNAEILGIDDRTGKLAEGYDADLLVLDGNPLEDLKILENPFMVVARGRLIEHPKALRNEKIESMLTKAGYGTPEFGANTRNNKGVR